MLLLYQKVQVFLLTLLIASASGASSLNPVIVTSELSDNLELYIRLINMDDRPVRYEIRALKVSQIHFKFVNAEGNNPIVPPKSVTSYPPFYKLLMPSEYIETKILLRQKFPKLTDALKKEPISLSWAHGFRIGYTEGDTDKKLVFGLYIHNVESLLVGDKHQLAKTPNK